VLFQRCQPRKQLRKRIYLTGERIFPENLLLLWGRVWAA
jgi:hypothetical protein